MSAVDWELCGQRLAAGIQALGAAVDPGTQSALIGYLRELVHWNGTHNLTAVREPEAMVCRHLIDSLAVLEHLRGQRLADVGSGAGLPGLVLAIARPDLAVTLIESSRKKSVFLRHARRHLALANVEIIQRRVEAWQPAADGFDTVICRAFAAAPTCLALAGHLLAPGGRFLLMKGRDPGAELAAVPAGFKVADTVSIAVPGIDAARHLAIIEHARA